MSYAGVAARPLLLAEELARRGLCQDVADAFAWWITARHPFARRVGVEALSREIARRGLEAGAAHDAALMLLALELLDGGLTFDRVVREVRRWDSSGHSGWAEAMEAARLHRKLAALAPRAVSSTIAERAAVACLGLSIVALLVCLAFVI
jgi:hypothetical protein